MRQYRYGELFPSSFSPRCVNGRQRASPVRRTAGARRRRAAHGIGPHGRVTAWPRRTPLKMGGSRADAGTRLACGGSGAGGLTSLLVRVMQAWERCAGAHTPQASDSRHPSTCTVTPALALHIHHSIHHHRPSSSVTSHQTYLVTSHRTPCESRVHSVLVEKGSLPRISTSRSRDVGSDHIFSSPPSIPYSSASSASVAAPCTDAWVSRLLPTLGRPGGPFSFVN